MRDTGKDIKRNSAKGLARVVQKDFMNGWLLDNQDAFVEVMELIKDGNPVKYAELYMKAYQMGIVKETNLNININRQQDYEDLQAMVRTRINPSLPQPTVEYTPYEEIRKIENNEK